MNFRLLSPGKRPCRLAILLASVASLLFIAPSAPAQYLATIHSFDSRNGGYWPTADLVLSGNALYGTTRRLTGGYGTVFRVNTDGSNFATLHSFTNLDDGEFPYAGVVLDGDTLYGTTENGGTNFNGTIFSIKTNGTGFTVVYNFPGDSDGANPVAPVLVSGGVLYGTTQQGGCNGKGVVFAVNADGTGYTNLHCFDSGPDGANPVAGLSLSGGTLYGTAAYGGNGTVFKVNTDSTGFQVLHKFTGIGDDGVNPQAGLTISGDTLYGTTDAGGLHGNGTVFKVSTSGTGYQTLYNFPTPSQGYEPTGVLALQADTLYSTTQEGLSPSHGMLFSMNTNGGSFTPLHVFTNGIDGAYPYTGVIASGGVLYGTALNGGAIGDGVVYAFNLSGSPPVVLAAARAGPGGLVLSWSSGAFTLQFASSLGGSWTNVPGATSPYTNDLSAPQLFFRLKSQ